MSTFCMQSWVCCLEEIWGQPEEEQAALLPEHHSMWEESPAFRKDGPESRAASRGCIALSGGGFLQIKPKNQGGEWVPMDKLGVLQAEWVASSPSHLLIPWAPLRVLLEKHGCPACFDTGAQTSPIAHPQDCEGCLGRGLAL